MFVWWGRWQDRKREYGGLFEKLGLISNLVFSSNKYFYILLSSSRTKTPAGKRGSYFLTFL